MITISEPFTDTLEFKNIKKVLSSKSFTDEFTSNLDNKNVNEILKKVKLLKNKTIIAISHDHNLENFFDRKIEVC